MAHWTRSFTGGSYRDLWRVTLDYYITEQDVANNRSYVVLKNFVYSTASHTYQYGNWDGRLYIDGGEVNRNTPNANISSGWYQMNYWEGWIYHNSDGTKGMNIGNYINAPVNEAHFAEIWWQLPTIPRHGHITNVKGNFNDEDYQPWIEFNYPAGGDRQVWLELPTLTGGTRYAQRNEVSSRYTWTLTESEMNALRNATKNVKSTTIRYKYANNVGGWVERSADRTFSIVNANPIFSTVSHKDINPTTVAITDNDQYLIQGKSTLEAKVASADKAEALKYATMSKYVFNVAGVSSEASYSSSADVLKSMGTIGQSTNQTLTVSAVDSRNNQTSVTQTVNVVPYSAPVLTATAQRLNNFEATTVVSISGSISLLNVAGSNKNAVNGTSGVQYRTRESGGAWGSWTNRPSTINASTGAIQVSNFNLTLDNTKAFDLEFRVTDRLETTTIGLTLAAGEAIFRISTHDEKVYNKEQVLMTSHIGMVLMSTTKNTAQSMADQYGGTWVAWGTGRVPVGIDTAQTEFNTIEKTGGHKLLQTHNHGNDSHNHSIPAGWYTYKGYGEYGIPNGGVLKYTDHIGETRTNWTTINIHNAGGGNSQNLQPYITVYMWKRTV